MLKEALAIQSLALAGEILMLDLMVNPSSHVLTATMSASSHSGNHGTWVASRWRSALVEVEGFRDLVLLNCLLPEGWLGGLRV